MITQTKTLSINDIVTDVQSGFASGERSNNGVVQLRMNNVTTDGSIDWSSFIRVPASGKQIKNFQLCKNDIVFNSTNSPELVGKTAIFTGFKEPVVFSNHFIRLRFDETKVDPEYLARWFNLQWQKRVFEKLSTQWVNQAAVRKEDLISLKLPLPPLPEQRRIAAILSKADRLRRLRRTARRLGDSYLQSVFLEMFYKSNQSWPQATISSVAKKGKNTIRTGPFGSQLLHSEFSDHGDVAVLGIDNVVQNYFTWGKRRYISEDRYQQLKRYKVYPGDVLITIMATTGRCAIAPDDLPLAINTKHLCCTTLNQQQCLPTYLQSCFLNHPDVLHQLGGSERGAIMPGLNMEIIKDLQIPIPPIDLQQKYACLVKHHERLHAQQREAERQAEMLFQSLLQKVFAGELLPL